MDCFDSKKTRRIGEEARSDQERNRRALQVCIGPGISRRHVEIMDIPLVIDPSPEDKKPYDLLNQKNPQLMRGFRGVIG